MAVVRSRGKSSGMREKQMGFCVACAAAKPIRSASSSVKEVACHRQPHDKIFSSLVLAVNLIEAHSEPLQHMIAVEPTTIPMLLGMLSACPHRARHAQDVCPEQRRPWRTSECISECTCLGGCHCEGAPQRQAPRQQPWPVDAVGQQTYGDERRSIQHLIVEGTELLSKCRTIEKQQCILIAVELSKALVRSRCACMCKKT